MKELHNNIFSNTTCISKETMLKHINHQLSKNELYAVEKHMLDCDLCSEAYEGMQYAQNSSMLFAIDSQIDQRVGLGNGKAPIMRNLMVAASLLVIIFGAYFTFNYFTNTIDNQNNLAVNQEGQPKKETTVEKSKNLEQFEGNTGENLRGNGVTSGKEELLLQDEEVDRKMKREDNFDSFDVVDDLAPAIPIEEPLADNIAYDDEIALAEVEVSERSNGAVINMNKAKGENEEQAETLSLVSQSDLPNATGEVSTTADEPKLKKEQSDGTKFGYAQSANDKSGASAKKDEKKTKGKNRNSGKKKRFKASTPATEYFDDGILNAEEDYRDQNQQKTITLTGYKVVDYSEEYQKVYEAENAPIVTKSVSADFESKADKDLAEQEKEETIVEITYRETLEKAIQLYKSNKYSEAIAQFDIILAAHPNEVNGWFYGGLSEYQLQRYTRAEGKLNRVLINSQTEFNEEATWYKALILIELKQKDHAKKLLKEIVSGGGFYKAKAEEQLKSL